MKTIKKYNDFLNESLLSNIGDFLKKIFRISPKDEVTVSTEDTEDSVPIEEIKPKELSVTDVIIDWSNSVMNQNQQVNNNLQKMADDISLDFYKNNLTSKISVINESPNISFYYTFDDGRKIKLSYIPGGNRGIIVYEMKNNSTTTFDINATIVNNWINEFSKLRTFAK